MVKQQREDRKSSKETYNLQEFIDFVQEGNPDLTDEQLAFLRGLYVGFVIIRESSDLTANDCQRIIDAYNTMADLAKKQKEEEDAKV